METEDFTIHRIFETFIESVASQTCDAGMGIEADLRLFLDFLLQEKRINYLDEIDSIILLEFMSYWLIKKSVLQDEGIVKELVNSLALFFQWLYDEYHVTLKSDFLEVYKRTKISGRRVLKALNKFYENTDPFQNLINQTRYLSSTVAGWYEIDKIERNNMPSMNLIHLITEDKLIDVALDIDMAIYLEKGDILYIICLHDQSRWIVNQIDYIFPRIAKPFIKL